MSHSDLLAQLASAGLYVYPRQGAWYAGLGGQHGDLGPFGSADEALVAAVGWLVRLYEDARAVTTECD